MILFVDDEKRRMDSYVEELLLSGHKVKFESDVETAFRFFEEHQSNIHLLVLDIMMPTGDGMIFNNINTDYGLLTGIAFYRRASAYVPNIPTIFFTNVSEVSLARDVLEKETVFFLEKSRFLPFELEEKICEILY